MELKNAIHNRNNWVKQILIKLLLNTWEHVKSFKKVTERLFWIIKTMWLLVFWKKLVYQAICSTTDIFSLCLRQCPGICNGECSALLFVYHLWRILLLQFSKIFDVSVEHHYKNKLFMGAVLIENVLLVYVPVDVILYVII